jgi:hypothetical protein
MSHIISENQVKYISSPNEETCGTKQHQGKWQKWQLNIDCRGRRLIQILIQFIWARNSLVLWNLEVHCPFQEESPPLDPIQTHFNAVHNFTQFLNDKYSTLSSGLCIGLQLNLFSWTLQTHTYYDIFISSMLATRSPFRISLDVIMLAISREENKLTKNFFLLFHAKVLRG